MLLILIEAQMGAPKVFRSMPGWGSCDETRSEDGWRRQRKGHTAQPGILHEPRIPVYDSVSDRQADRQTERQIDR